MSAVLALELLVGFGCSPHCLRRVLGLLPNGAHNGFLAHMGFEPIINGEPRLMDARVFADGLMGLKDDLLTVPLEARFAYDTERNTFFLNMEGMSLATLDDVESIGSEIEKRLAAIGKGVQMVVNYDNFYLAPDLTDAYVTLVRRLAEPYYAAVTRYTPSSYRSHVTRCASNPVRMKRQAPRRGRPDETLTSMRSVFVPICRLRCDACGVLAGGARIVT